MACIAFLFAVYPGFVAGRLDLWSDHLDSSCSTVFTGRHGLNATGPLVWPLTFWRFRCSLGMLLTECFFNWSCCVPVFLWLVLGERSSVDNVAPHAVAVPYVCCGGDIPRLARIVFKSIRPETDQSIFFC